MHHISVLNGENQPFYLPHRNSLTVPFFLSLAEPTFPLRFFFLVFAQSMFFTWVRKKEKARFSSFTIQSCIHFHSFHVSFYDIDGMLYKSWNANFSWNAFTIFNFSQTSAYAACVEFALVNENESLKNSTIEQTTKRVREETADDRERAREEEKERNRNEERKRKAARREESNKTKERPGWRKKQEKEEYRDRRRETTMMRKARILLVPLEWILCRQGCKDRRI